MKKVIAFLIVIVISSMALTAMNGSSVFSIGYTVDSRKSSAGDNYMYFGPNLGFSKIRVNGESASAGFYNHLTMTLVTNQLTTSYEWVKIDFSNRLNVLAHELCGIGVLIPLSSNLDLLLGTGLSLDLDFFSSSSLLVFEEIFGLGIGADIRLLLTDSICLNISTQTSYSICGWYFYQSNSYSDVIEINFSKRNRISGVKAKIGFGFCF